MKHERAVRLLCDNPGCEKAFFTKKSLYEHKRNHTNVRNYACKFCNFKAKTSSALRIHQDIHKVGNAVSCDICNATFPTLRKLKAHMSKLMTSYFGSKKYFRINSSLKVSHSNLTPFICCYCDSSFKRKKDLKDHENIHSKL